MSVVMKPSGVEWIGDIPEKWIVSKLKRRMLFSYGDSLSEENRITGNIDVFGSNGVVGSHNSALTNGETIIIGRKGSAGKVNYTESSCFPIDTTFFLDKDNTSEHIKWLAYLLPLLDMDKMNSDSAVPGLNRENAYKIYIAFPTIDEQKTIAIFLDKATAKIDKAILTKQTQLETLEALKKSIIHKAVTKGLDESVSMKDSKIEWIGDIPEHWTTQKLKRTTTIKGRIGWQGLTSDEYRTEGNHMLVTGTDFKGRYINWDTCHYVDEERYDEDTKIQLIDKDVLVTKDGTIGKISMVKDMPYPTTLNSGVFVTRPIKNDYIQEYMYWVLYSDMLMEFINYSKVGTTIAHLYQKTFERFTYALPPLKEQRPIVDFLDKEVEKINTLKSNVKKQIEKLQEYKKSLIYEYVTGKKQVKE